MSVRLSAIDRNRLCVCLWNGLLSVARTSPCILLVCFECRYRVTVERLSLIGMTRLGWVIVAINRLLTTSDLPPVSVKMSLVLNVVRAGCSLMVLATLPSIARMLRFVILAVVLGFARIAVLAVARVLVVAGLVIVMRVMENLLIRVVSVVILELLVVSLIIWNWLGPCWTMLRVRALTDLASFRTMMLCGTMPLMLLIACRCC